MGTLPIHNLPLRRHFVALSNVKFQHKPFAQHCVSGTRALQAVKSQSTPSGKQQMLVKTCPLTDRFKGVKR